MEIKFLALEREEGQTAAGKEWLAYKIIGTELDSGKAWGSPKIFDNKYNENIVGKAAALDVGDVVSVKLEKNTAGYWAVTNIEEATGEPAPNPRGSSSHPKPKAVSSGSSDKMSKSDWAAKDEITRASIARAVALKEANVNTKLNCSVDAIIEMAQKFEPYLLGKLDVHNTKGDGLEAPSI